MYTGTVWGITLLILGFLLSLGALQLVMTVAAPGPIGQAARNLERRGLPGQIGMFVAGLLGLGITLTIIAVLADAGPLGKVVQAVLAIPTAFTVAAGLAAASLCVGGRLPSPADAERPWRRLVRGATALGLSWVVPFVGWFLILPGCAVMGTGALLLSLFQLEGRREARRAWLPAADEPGDAAEAAA